MISKIDSKKIKLQLTDKPSGLGILCCNFYHHTYYSNKVYSKSDVHVYLRGVGMWQMSEF